MDGEAFLRDMFKGLLGREPEPEAAAYLLAQYAAGRPFADLVHEIASSAECRARHRQHAGLFVPPGHVHSPVCDPAQLAPRFQDPAQAPADLLVPGIRLNAEAQWRLWEAWRPMLAELSFPVEAVEGWRYHTRNPEFGGGDAALLHCMLRWLRPRRYIGIGSGHAAACALDTIDRHLGRQVEVMLVDPASPPLPWLGDEAWVVHQAASVQAADPALWDALAPNDILFVDSSHVAKTGSDVLALLFDILPRLRPGVVVQVHDVFFPFEYPAAWVLDENRSWNELYMLRAFLTDNPGWEILFFADHFRRLAPRLVAETCPAFAEHGGGSLWLRRV